MTLHRSSRLASFATIFILFLSPPLMIRAADPTWESARTTVPEDVAELKALQAKVKAVVDKCSPATVGVLIGSGAGSGVIVSDDGLVLTAAHVSGEAGHDCTLVLQDGKRVRGKTLGTNDRNDSGMIRITDKGPNDGKWPFLKVAKSADLKKGQWVVSLGHPGGYKKERPPVARLGRMQTVNKDLLRTDCTLVGGDSGGPLFNLDGDVVGIHSRIGLTLNQNIHVPADAFKAEWDQLVRGDEIGKPVKPTPVEFGVEFDDKAKTARLAEVYESSPAAEAGLQTGDEIVKFDGLKIVTADDVRKRLLRRKPGDIVKIEVLRDDETMTFSVTLARPLGVSSVKLGVIFDDKATTARVEQVNEGDPAAKAGLKAGDVIVKFGDSKIATAADVRKRLQRRKPGDTVKVEVLRDDETMTFNVKLAPR